MAILRVDVEEFGAGSGVVLRCQGELDAHTFQELEDPIIAAIEKGVLKIIVDLTGVSYMSSAGMGVLISSHSEAEDMGGQLALLNPNAVVREALESIGLDDVFVIGKSEKELLQQLGVA